MRVFERFVFVVWICRRGLSKTKKIHSIWPFPWKRSVWQNPDQERTNQNARIHLKTILPYNNECYCMKSGAIIGDGDRKSWDSRGPMIWDNFYIFRTNCAILTSWIHARVVGSRVDVVTLRGQLVRVARNSCRFFTAMAGNKAERKNQGSSVYFNALM